MSSTKDKLFTHLKKIYGAITPAEIKQSVATNDALGNIRSSIQRQREAEDKAKRMEAERKVQERRDKIKKVTYSPREQQQFRQAVASRLPAGSKIKRLIHPSVSNADMDDLSDMFSSVRASPDQMTDLMSGLNLNRFGGPRQSWYPGETYFGKNRFGS